VAQYRGLDMTKPYSLDSPTCSREGVRFNQTH